MASGERVRGREGGVGREGERVVTRESEGGGEARGTVKLKGELVMSWPCSSTYTVYRPCHHACASRAVYRSVSVSQRKIENDMYMLYMCMCMYVHVCCM